MSTDSNLIDQVLLGNNKDFLPKIPDGSVGMTLTDPPYGIGYKSNYRAERFDTLAGDDKLNSEDMKELIAQLHRTMKANSHFYCFTRWDVYPEWKKHIELWFEIKNILVVKRVNTSMGDLFNSFAPAYEMVIFAVKGQRGFNPVPHKGVMMNRFPDFIDFIPANDRREKYLHPTKKNVALCRHFIELSSNPEDVVLDPFAGAGSTLVACKQLNRRFVGVEISPEYCEIARKRIRAVPVRLDKFF